MDSLPKTNSHRTLKMEGWNTILSLLGFGLFSGANLLFSFRQIYLLPTWPRIGMVIGLKGVRDLTTVETRVKLEFLM